MYYNNEMDASGAIWTFLPPLIITKTSSIYLQNHLLIETNIYTNQCQFTLNFNINKKRFLIIQAISNYCY